MKNNLELHCGGKKEKRRENDFYPTPIECTIALVEFLKIENMNIWEPCCGNGAISKILSIKNNVYSSDLNDYNFGESGIDYLKCKKEKKFDAIITNPPFYIASEIIKKAISESDIVCMLLKSQYWHSQSRYKLFMKNIPSYILPLTWRPNFAPDRGSAPIMEVHWTVWIKGNSNSKYIPLLKPNLNLSMF